jgi:hypothetical protein
MRILDEPGAAPRGAPRGRPRSRLAQEEHHGVTMPVLRWTPKAWEVLDGATKPGAPAFLNGADWRLARLPPLGRAEGIHHFRAIVKAQRRPGRAVCGGKERFDEAFPLATHSFLSNFRFGHTAGGTKHRPSLRRRATFLAVGISGFRRKRPRTPRGSSTSTSSAVTLSGEGSRSSAKISETVLPAEAAKTRVGGRPLVTTIPDAECRSRTTNMDGGGGIGSSDTLARLATHSKMIVRGTVRTVDLGFSFGAPTSLLGVEVTEVLKGEAPKSPFYVAYPVARFRIGPYSFCNLERGFEPQPGDELLLFAYSGTVDRDEILYAPRLDQMVFQGQDGALFLPSSLKDRPEVKTARTLDDVIRPVKSFLGYLGHAWQERKGGDVRPILTWDVFFRVKPLWYYVPAVRSGFYQVS